MERYLFIKLINYNLNNYSIHYSTMDILNDLAGLHAIAHLTIAQNQIEQNLGDEYVNNIELFCGELFKNTVFEICMAMNRPLPNIESTPHRTTPERITHFFAHTIEYEYVEDFCGILLDILDRLIYCLQCQEDVNNTAIMPELELTSQKLRRGLWMFTQLWLALNLQLRYNIYHMLFDDYNIDLVSLVQ